MNSGEAIIVFKTKKHVNKRMFVKCWQEVKSILKLIAKFRNRSTKLNPNDYDLA